jgi:hypothetical protein
MHNISLMSSDVSSYPRVTSSHRLDLTVPWLVLLFPNREVTV